MTKKGKKMKKDNLENLENGCENEVCDCQESCDCEEECSDNGCGCHQGEECTCGPDCKCQDCDEGCSCQQSEGENESGEECSCDDKKDEPCECCAEKQIVQADEYLVMAQRLQADFDNYRKRVADQLERERQEGARSVIEVFLPCLDSFKEAKKSITDENILAGFNMVENKILDALGTLKVERINSIGQHFDPHLHNVIAVLCDQSKENDTILEEYQSGWMMNGKVIRYAKVVVNKK